MGLKWVDVLDIGIELAEKFPDQDPTYINFVDLRNMVMALDDFDDDPARCGEKVLEAIQSAWLDERD
ncbi:Fe-S cluster assembly protein IscX [Spongiibacter sp. KMU-158]|uniref:Fe-S cluster assembly protein IscX n=1 Tax=Spongiibacter pelagi TaxID=2760804 RepID=A0A927C270_9GAMM|nr:Fe-S cluster assembly protein IscX [Spongiibacter pelagi]MBD2858281.1 Fe-S cluster assembly protein IscX [Spongiibacter pelagi]